MFGGLRNLREEEMGRKERIDFVLIFAGELRDLSS